MLVDWPRPLRLQGIAHLATNTVAAKKRALNQGNPMHLIQPMTTMQFYGSVTNSSIVLVVDAVSFVCCCQCRSLLSLLSLLSLFVI
jgi:hypothetical protein